MEFIAGLIIGAIITGITAYYIGREYGDEQFAEGIEYAKTIENIDLADLGY